MLLYVVDHFELSIELSNGQGAGLLTDGPGFKPSNTNTKNRHSIAGTQKGRESDLHEKLNCTITPGSMSLLNYDIYQRRRVTVQGYYHGTRATYRTPLPTTRFKQNKRFEFMVEPTENVIRFGSK